MSFDVEQYVHYRIANAQLLNYPFPHFYVQDIFPPDWYQELIARLPAQEYYVRLDETGSVTRGAYPERFVCTLSDAIRAEEKEDGEPGPWREMADIIGKPQFAHRVLGLFNDAVAKRFGAGSEVDFDVDCRLVRDFSNYAIAPHTDSPRKIVSLLFYMPADESMKSLGTSLYVPNDPELRCEGLRHHSFANFKKVMTASYSSNSLFGFFKTDQAFHGVERIELARVRRDSMLYNITVRKPAPRASTAPA